MVTLYKIIISLSLLLVSSGEPLSCNDGSLMDEDGVHCNCLDGSFFNAYEGKCQGLCEYFGDTVCTFYFANTACMQNQFNATDYDCGCANGYELDIDSEMCLDVDECSENGTLSCPESEYESCYNVEGEDLCDCMQYYFRNDEYNCQEMDLCNMPDDLTSCEQVCIYGGDYSFYCSCYEPFALNNSDTMCALETGYSECECEINPEYGVCAESSNGTQTCYPLPGYQFASDNITLEDINECEDMTYQCPIASTCINDIGGYHCDCWPGYHKVEDDFVLNGCEPMACGEGMILYNGSCVEPCDGLDVSCPPMSVCFTDDNNIPICSCQVECQNSGLSNSSTFSIYSVSIFLPYENATAFEYSFKKYLLTKTMESIFGKGNAEVVEGSIQDAPQHGFGITLQIGVSMPLEDIDVIRDAILKHCLALEGDFSQPQCVLPGGLIVNRYSIAVNEIYRCEDTTACEDVPYSMCMESMDFNISSGRYWCECMDGFELIEGFYCEDINECITGDEDCEDGMVCVNGVGNYSCQFDGDGLSTLQYLIDDANKEIITEKSRVTELYQNLDEQKKKTKTVGGAVGGIFGVIFIILVVALVYVSRIRSKKAKSPLKEVKEGSKVAMSDSPTPGRSDSFSEPLDSSP